MIHTNEAASALVCARRALLYRTDKPDPHDFAKPDRAEYRRRYEELLSVLDVPCGQTGDPASRSLEILEKYKAGKDLRFESQSIRTTIPLIQYDESCAEDDPRYIAVYPVYGTTPKDNLLYRLYADAAVLDGCGIHLSAIRLIALRKDLISNADMPAGEIFTVHESLKKMRGGWHRATALEMVENLAAKESYSDFLSLVHDFYNRDENGAADEIIPRKVKACTNPKCPLYDTCWGESALPDDSSAFLFSTRFRPWFEENGVERLEQIDGKHMEGSLMQYAQIMAARSGGVYMDAPAVDAWFKSLSYPISYLDFEWDTYVLSPYDGMKPFDVLCFQYSLHIEDEQGNMEHCAFFETGDCRIDFIEALIEDLPKEGSILVFNMEGAERLRLLQLASQYEQYRKPLEKICERMVDLAVPFECGSYYDIRQRAHSSLKTLLPLFTDEVSYSDLDVGNGVEAVYVYRNAAHSAGVEQLALARNISDYCTLDTLAEKKLADGLKHKLEEEKCQI